RWTCKSTRDLSGQLKKCGYQVSHTTVSKLLKDAGFSLQANRKTIEGKQHPDRDAQFRHISSRIRSQQRAGQPALSVDTKKKEIIGTYKKSLDENGAAKDGPLRFRHMISTKRMKGE